MTRPVFLAECKDNVDRIINPGAVDGAPMRPATRGLVITGYYPPDDAVGGLRASRFCRYLPRHGFQPVVIARRQAGVAYPANQVVRCPLEDPPTRRLVLAERAAEAFQRHLLPYNEELPWVPHAISAANDILKRTPVAAVLSTSPPVATHLAALYLKLRYGIKWIADFRDPVSGNAFRIRKYTSGYNALLQHAILAHADAVITVTDTIHEEWLERYQPWARKIHLIWNGFDPEEAAPQSAIPDRPYRVLAHVGSIYGGRHPHLLLAAMERLISLGRLNPAQVRVRLIGVVEEATLRPHSPPARTLIEHGCLECGMGDVPRDAALRAIAEADFLLLLDGNALSIGYTLPAKVFEYIRTGRPILAITGRSSPVDRILSRSGIPFLCLYYDDPAEQVDTKVLQFFGLKSEPVEPSAWFLSQFDGRRQVQTLAEILTRVCS